MRALELFSGTGSVGSVLQADGWEVISVDVQKKFNPTICCSVLDLPLDKWEPGYFTYIHASPPCCEYSVAHTGNARDMEKADLLAIHALSLIRALKPRFWTLENPQSGKLKARWFMNGFPFSDCAYCKYSDWGYRKRTRIWHNIPGLVLEDCKNDCPNMVLKAGRLVHRCSAQKGPSRGTPEDRCFKSEELYRIPPKLVEKILEAIQNNLN